MDRSLGVEKKEKRRGFGGGDHQMSPRTGGWRISKTAIPFDTGVDFEKISFSKVGPSKNRYWGPSGSSFWRLLGTLLEPLGTLLAPCVALWEPLGSIFGSVGRLVAHLGAFWATFDASGMAF